MAAAVALGSEDAALAKAVAVAWAKAEFTPGLPAACMSQYRHPESFTCRKLQQDKCRTGHGIMMRQAGWSALKKGPSVLDSLKLLFPEEADNLPEAYALASAFATAPPPLLLALAMDCAKRKCTAW